MSKREIWTPSARHLLYERLVALFGPYDEWEKSSSPGRGLDDDFMEFCDHFAQVVGADTGGAVKMQIRFAMPEKNGSSWDQSHARSAILNKAAALEAGFIGHGHLPELYATGGSLASA
jgi:hypothetical protein